MNLDWVQTRRDGVAKLLPQWQEARKELKEARGDTKRAKATEKAVAEDLEKLEQSLEHLAECRLGACLRCEELALNGAVGRG